MNCNYCEKTLASRQSLQRHVARLHKNEEINPREDDNDIDNNDQSMEISDDDEQAVKVSSDDDNDVDNNSTSESSSGGDPPPKPLTVTAPLFRKLFKEQKRERANARYQDYEGMDAWRYILDEAFGENVESTLFADKNKIMEELNLIRKTICSHKRLVRHITSSATYDLIDDEKDRLIKRGYDKEEGIKVAWFNRRFRVKNYLKKVLRSTKSIWFINCSSDEDEDEEEKVTTSNTPTTNNQAELVYRPWNNDEYEAYAKKRRREIAEEDKKRPQLN